jgi:hypothetical protein
MTYNGDAKEWRSDFTYSGLANNDCSKVLISGAQGPFRSAVLHTAPKVVADYVLKASPAGGFVCYTYPVHTSAFSTTYLQNATAVGDETITTLYGESLKTTAYNNTNIYGDGTLTTYVDPTTNAIVRHQYFGSQASSGSLTGNYDMTIDFPPSTSFVALTVDQVPSELSPFASLGCMPV